MITLPVLVLPAATANLPSGHNAEVADSSITHPAFVYVPKVPNGLTLYNEKGEVVARCGKKGDTFQDCKMESGVNLDDLMKGLGSCLFGSPKINAHS